MTDLSVLNGAGADALQHGIDCTFRALQQVLGVPLFDDLARFVNPETVVLCAASDPADAATLRGAGLKVVKLPMPRPLWFDGRQLPASYANFYIANAAVIVPTFNDPADRVALGILGELFRDRPVVGIHAVDLVLGFGTLHCLTQQHPA